MSKELEALEFIKLDYGVEPQGYELIKFALERKEKLEKVYEIIKNKNPRLSLIKSMIKTNTLDFERYNILVYSYEQLTETEFNLLKEMLK